MNATDERMMTLALGLGRRGLGRVWPNPNVGCVIVQGDRIVGRGWTQDGGRPHAEAMALTQAGEAARGADVYVTLEPCAHHGQTPPCATALISAGVSRVIVACGDPDERVAGRGIAMLREAGITVDVGLGAARARADLAGFLSRIECGRPFVTLKLASSVDGRIATASGDSQWITDVGSRRAVHMMRARHDAVMVGGGTARADDPSLTQRDLGIDRQPVRVVVSRRLDVPLGGKLATTAGEVPVWMLHGEDASGDLVSVWNGLGATCIACRVENQQVSILAALEALAERGLTRVLCEGGGALAASLMAARCVDELVCMTAGVAIGAEGTPSLGALGLAKLARAQRFELAEVRAIGGDILHRWVPTDGPKT